MLYNLYKGRAGGRALTLHCFPSDQTDGRGHVFIEMKMFQLLITEATGEKKKKSILISTGIICLGACADWLALTANLTLKRYGAERSGPQQPGVGRGEH